MVSKRHFLFNLVLLIVPWLTVLFLGKRNVKRYYLSGLFIILFEIINHIFGHKRKWWKFYDGNKAFMRNELPFTVGPYMPLSMWILKYSYGNFKKFLLLNAISDGLFAFFLIKILKKLRIVRLNRLSNIQFFLYLYYKAFLLYGVQYFIETKTSLMHKDESTA
ncbi:hypothetical protein [Ornithinibacillus contaminans]|uniref:hypothetical protein n=1 Tax=Ornithinibacillus contaminans TaxID=694055 RepID=UPI00064D91DC|nr:hypothetical protein [Ornithinibacillus contaminans]